MWAEGWGGLGQHEHMWWLMMHERWNEPHLLSTRAERGQLSLPPPATPLLEIQSSIKGDEPIIDMNYYSDLLEAWNLISNTPDTEILWLAHDTLPHPPIVVGSWLITIMCVVSLYLLVVDTISHSAQLSPQKAQNLKNLNWHNTSWDYSSVLLGQLDLQWIN